MDTAQERAQLDSKVTAGSNAETAAVLYVCVERGKQIPTPAEERAIEEGRSFAAKKALRIVAEITDPFGEHDPGGRPGWRRVREMVAGREVSTVILRWPTALSPHHEMRYREIAWCKERGVRVLYSWIPLADWGAEDQ